MVLKKNPSINVFSGGDSEGALVPQYLCES